MGTRHYPRGITYVSGRGMERLYGRGKVIDFVKAALRCDDVGNRPLPILLLVGPHGSGGSALLAKLWEEVGDDCPCVPIDTANAEHVADVLLTAGQGLRRHVWGIRPLRFPRLGLALKALSFDDSGGRGRPDFNTYMRKGGRTAKASSTLEKWTDRVGPLLLSPDHQLYAKLAAWVFGGLLSEIDRSRDRASLRWFAERSDVAGGSELDPLWRLYHWQWEQDEDKRHRADKTLCDAFLTDIRTDYNDTGLRHGPRSRNPCLLLDNADSRVGKRVLELIEESRRKSGREGEPADSLLAVAIQRHPPSREIGEPIDVTKQGLDFTRLRGEASAADYLTLWRPVYLSALSASEVVEMTPSHVLGVSSRVHHNHRDAEYIRSLTGGHPEATSRLAALLPRLNSPSDLRSLLYQSIPLELRDDWQITSDTNVGDYLLKRAFADDLKTSPGGGISADGNAWLDAMATGAATPGFRLGACHAALQYCEWTEVTAEEARDRLTETMWRTESDDGQPRLHPLAVLLLRYWLARDPAKWTSVHEGYVTHYSGPGDLALRNRHILALVVPDPRWMESESETASASEPSHMGQSLDVVTYLGREWESDPALASETAADTDAVRRQTRAWLNVLDTVVSAPNRLQSSRSPEAFVKALAGGSDSSGRYQIIARLTIARWLFNDRLFDPTRRLAPIIVDEYNNLARLPGGDTDLFLEEAAKYRKIQREWED